MKKAISVRSLPRRPCAARLLSLAREAACLNLSPPRGVEPCLSLSSSENKAAEPGLLRARA